MKKVRESQENCRDVLTSDEVDFRAKDIAKDKEGYLTVIKWLIHQEDIRLCFQYILPIVTNIASILD